MIPQANSGKLIPVEEGQSQRRWILPEALQYLAEEGDYEGISAILTTFKTDTSSRLNLLRSAVASADAAAIRTQAHAISGSARLVGADAMVSVCREIEVEAANGSAAELSKLLEIVQDRFEECCRSSENVVF